MSNVKTCEHCWHDNGYILASNPPQYPQTCCKCGEQRVLRSEPYKDTKQHGPFAPMNGAML